MPDSLDNSSKIPIEFKASDTTSMIAIDSSEPSNIIEVKVETINADAVTVIFKDSNDGVVGTVDSPVDPEVFFYYNIVDTHYYDCKVYPSFFNLK